MKTHSKSKKNTNGGLFSAETFGMTLMLFSSVSIILMLLTDVLFGKQIGYVQFLFGVFGYFAFAIMSALCFTGVILVLGKKVKGDWKKVTLVSLFLFFTVCLVHTITADNYVGSFSEYLSYCYNLGENGIASCTAGGALFAIPVYPVLRYLTSVGCYVLFSVLMAITVLLMFRLYVSNAVKKATNKNRINNKVISEYKDYPDDDFDFNTPPSMQPNSGLYFGEGSGEFVQATRKERKSERARALNLLYPENYKENERKTDVPKVTYGNIQQFNQQRSDNFTARSYQTQTERDMRDNRNNVRQNDNYQAEDVASFERNGSVTERRVIDRFNSERSTSQNSATYSRANSANMNRETERGIEERYYENSPSRDNNFDNSNRGFGNEDRLYTRDANMSRDNSFERAITRDNRLNNVDGANEGRKPRNPFDRQQRINLEPIKEEHIGEELDNELPRAAVRDDKKPFAGKWSNLPKNNDNHAEPIINAKQDSMFEKKDEETIKPSNITKFNLNSEKKSIYIEPDTGEAVMPDDERNKKDDRDEQSNAPENIEYMGIPGMPIRYRYNAPPIELYNDNPKKANTYDDSVEERCRIIEKTLENFNVPARVENVVKGPTITRYEISIPEGITVSKVPPRASDLAMRLEVEAVRIEAPIPGKNLIGIEVPNKIKEMVGMKELLLEKDYRKSNPDALSIVLGEDVVGNPVITDLTKTPHLLVAGATGMGKSVFLNSLIMSLITKYGPDDLRLVLVDPKQVEFSIFENLPHLLIDHIITEASLCIGILDWAIDEMEQRYKIFRHNFAQKIDEYNHSINPKTQRKMPKIVIIIDELGDLFSISPQIKHDIEDRIRRLTQKARAAGIHVIVATQRPDVTVITGVIKTNLPSRVAFKVLNYQDSNTILSDGGAERLLGNGDMIFKTSNSALLRRIQGSYVSKEEMVRVITYIKDNNTSYFDTNAQKYLDAKKASTQNAGTAASITFGDDGEGENDANTYNNVPIRNLIALRYVIEKKQASISALQRCMSIGYSTAGRIIDWMENMNYISPHEGSKARKVLITMEEFENLYGEADLD